MPQFHLAQIPPPKSWQEFEELCADLWQELFNSTNTELNGRTGQPQNGVDVYGQIGDSEKWFGVQCKGKDIRFNEHHGVSEEELKAEVEKAKGFEPKLTRFVLATTAPNDAKIQDVARKITVEHQKSNLFSVQVKSWDEIHRDISKYKSLIEKYYPEFVGSDSSVAKKIEQLSSAIDRAATLPNSRLDDAISLQINGYRDLINGGQSKTALKLLVGLKDSSWNSLSNFNKFRVLTNIAACHLELNNKPEAARFFIDAHEIEPGEEKALCNLVVAHHLLGDSEKVTEAANNAVSAFPNSAAANRLKVSSTKFGDEDIPENMVPKELHHLPEICFAIGQAYLEIGKIESAIEWFKSGSESKNTDLSEVKSAYASALLQKLYDVHHISIGIQLSDSERGQLHQINSIFSELWEETKNNESLACHSVLINNLLITKILLSDISGALIITNEVFSKDELDEQLVKTTALLLLEVKQNEKAIEIVKIAFDKDPEKWALLYSETLASNRKFSEALSIIQDYVLLGDSLENEDSMLGVEIKLLSLTNGELPHVKIQEALAKFPNSVFLQLDISNTYFKNNMQEKAIEFAETANALLHDGSSYYENMNVADNFFELEQYENAIPLYEKLVVKHVDSQMLRNLIRCYYECNYRRKLLELFQELPSKTRTKNFYRQYAAAIYEVSGLYQEAITEIEEYLKENQSDLRETLHWFSLCLRLNKQDEIVRYLRKEISYESSNSLDFMNLASFHCECGDFETGINLASKTALENFDNADIQMAYVQLFLMRNNEEDTSLSSEIVESGSYVCFESDKEEQISYFLSNRAIYGVDTLPLEHPLAIGSIAKKVGESIDVQETPYTSKTYKIISVQSLPVFLFQSILKNFSNRFPNYHKPFWSINVKGAGEEEYDFTGLFKVLDAQKQHTTEVLTDYKSKAYPICLVAKLLGRPLLDVWVGMQADKSERVFNCVGTAEERNMALDLLDQSYNYIIDPLTLHTAFSLNVQDVLLSSLGNLSVTQSCIDFYNQLIALSNANKDKRTGTMGKSDGGYYTYEHESETLEQITEQYQSILKWIQESCSIVAAVENEKPSETMKVLSEAFDRVFYDTLVAAEGTGYVLVSEDLRFRQLADLVCNAKGVWLQPALIKAVEQKVMDARRYAHTIAKLAHRGFFFTSVSQESLSIVVESNDWQVSDELKSMLDTLGGEDSDLLSSISVAVTFMMDCLETKNFETIAYATINALTINYCHSRSEEILGALIKASGFFMRYYGKREALYYLNVIYKWCEGHFIAHEFFEKKTK